MQIVQQSKFVKHITDYANKGENKTLLLLLFGLILSTTF